MAQSNPPLADRMEPVAGSGTPIVIAPGHTFTSVTDKISSIVLTQRTPIGWYLALMCYTLLHTSAPGATLGRPD